MKIFIQNCRKRFFLVNWKSLNLKSFSRNIKLNQTNYNTRSPLCRYHSSPEATLVISLFNWKESLRLLVYSPFSSWPMRWFRRKRQGKLFHFIYNALITSRPFFDKHRLERRERQCRNYKKKRKEDRTRVVWNSSTFLLR